MKLLRLRPIRTALALLLAFALGFALAEEVVADVHDGGATHAELDQVTGAAHQDHSPNSADSPPGSTSPEQSDHSAHVCHCTHAHGGIAMAVQFMAVGVIRPAVPALPRVDARLMGISSPPATRPPIA